MMKPNLSEAEKVMLVLAGFKLPERCARGWDQDKRKGKCKHYGRGRPSRAEGGGLCVCCTEGSKVALWIAPYLYNCDGSIHHESLPEV